jgi:peptide/nickel transport system substrate-binding protein
VAGGSVAEEGTVKRTRSVAVIAVASLWVLAACTGGGDETTSASAPDHATTDVVARAIDAGREGPAEPIDGAVEGGTVTVLSQAMSTRTLDPTQAYNQDVLSILRGLLTRSLTQWVYDPAQHTMVLVPDIATDTGRSNADFTQWTFTIREGVRYENGNEVTADDVAYGIKRSFDQRTFDEGAGGYSSTYFLDGDTYHGPYRSGTSYRGVVVKGNTLTLKMSRPFPDMPYWASFPAMGPIPELRSDPATYWRHPLATGPYRIARYTPKKSLILVRNQEWDPDTDPGRHAYPDRYVFDFTSPSKRIVATILGDSRRGRTSVAYPSPVSQDFITTSVYLQARKLNRLAAGPGRCTFWVAPDYRKITDIRVRKAIGYAYPSADLYAASGDTGAWKWVPATSILPPGFPGRQDFNPLSTRPGTTDPDRARALLKQAGYAPGEYVLTWPYDTSDPASVARNEAISHALQVGGFKTRPYRLRTGQDLYDVSLDPKAPINLRTEAGVGWCPDWPSGTEWFSTETFHSPGGLAFFAEPAVDKEIDRISQLRLDEQAAEWGALDKTIMTKYYPVVITGYQQEALLHGSHIGGLRIDTNVPMPVWQDLHVIS